MVRPGFCFEDLYEKTISIHCYNNDHADSRMRVRVIP